MPRLSEISFQESNVIFYNSTGFVLKDNEFLTKISLKSSTVNFKENCFYHLTRLETISCDESSSISQLGTNSFVDCPLIPINLPIDFIDSRAIVNSCKEEITIMATNVSEYAISACPQLTYVKIGPTVQYLGARFIENCPQFISLEFLNPEAESPKLEILSKAFWKIDTFDFISRLPDRTVSIGSFAFTGCTKITGSLDLPKKLESIGANAFQGCTGLNGFLTFTNCTELTEIKACAFLGCSHISGTLTLPPSLVSIGEFAFTYCNFAGPLVIPDHVTTIASHAFAMCNTFTGTLSIGTNVLTIGEYAFSECTGLNGQIEIHSNVLTDIGANAFYGCTNISGMLVLPESLRVIGAFAFYDCHSLTSNLVLPSHVTFIGESAFALCNGFSGILKLPSGISYIGTNAFFKCQGLIEIHFPKKVNSSLIVENKAFGDLKINCLLNVPSICSISNSSNKVGYQGDGNSRCYDSSNFDWLAQTGTLGENCELKEACQIIIAAVTAIAATGIFGVAFRLFLQWFKNIYSYKRRIQLLFF